jgi:hypothetical protein
MTGIGRLTGSTPFTDDSRLNLEQNVIARVPHMQDLNAVGVSVIGLLPLDWFAE